MKGDKNRVWKGDDLVIRLERGDDPPIYQGTCRSLTFPVQIGRSGACAWRIPDGERTISGLHAELFVRRGKLFVRDLGSRNGIYFKGKRVDEYHLTAGEEVGIGPFQLSVDKVQTSSRGNQLLHHRFEYLNGPKAGKIFEITKTTTPVGNSLSGGAEDGLGCESFLVSYRHAEIILKPDDVCELRDLGSSNGTRVNGEVLKKDAPCLLTGGDIVSFADCQFRYLGKEDSAPRLGWKVLVACVTATCCGVLYFLFLLMYPSAQALLDKAREYESQGRFDLAKEQLNRALTARGGDSYRQAISDRFVKIALWKKTQETWSRAQAAFPERKWNVASKELGSLLDNTSDRWDWNTTKAQQEKNSARLLKRYLEIFLHARRALGGEYDEDERDHEEGALVARLKNLNEALSDPAWTDSLPTGKLREDMQELYQTIQKVVEALRHCRTVITGIHIPELPEDSFAGALAVAERFEANVAEIKGIIRDEDERRVRRKETFEKARILFMDTSIVREKYERYLPVLERFVAARSTFESNLLTCAETQGEADLVRDLPFPSDQQCAMHPLFGEIRRRMETANALLCGGFRRGLRDQVGRLKERGVVSGETPTCLKTLLDEKVMAQVFSCDVLKGPRPAGTRTTPVGQYDTVLGLEAFADFLSELDGETPVRYQAAEGSDCPTPKLVAVCQINEQFARFQRFLGQENAVTLLACNPPKGNAVRELAQTVSGLSAKRRQLVDAWWYLESDDARTVLIARGAALALDGGQSLVLKDRKAYLAELGKLKTAITARARRIKSNPDQVEELRNEILKMGIPGLHGVNGFWDQRTRVQKEMAP